MRAYQQNTGHLHVRARSAPLCYSRHPQSHETEQARVDTQSSSAVVALGVAACAAAFAIGWLGGLI